MFRAGIRASGPDVGRHGNIKVGSPAGRRPTGGPILKAYSTGAASGLQRHVTRQGFPRALELLNNAMQNWQLYGYTYREVSVDRNTATDTQTLKYVQGSKKPGRKPKNTDTTFRNQEKLRDPT
jgi:hypothetical protein